MKPFFVFYKKFDYLYRECIIYKDNQRYPMIKGCGVITLLVTLSDGRKIRTNDLWYEDITYLDLPINALTGIVEVNVNDEPVDETYIY